MTGSVTIDGKPVPKGQITFSPAEKGPVTGATIADGKYTCQKVPLGKHHVSFIAQAAEMTTMIEVATGMKREVPQNILPQQYASGIDVEVKADTKALDFPLNTGP